MKCKCGNEARYITSKGEYTCAICPISQGVDSFRLSDVPALLAWARQHLKDEAEDDMRNSARMNPKAHEATDFDLRCIIGRGTGDSIYAKPKESGVNNRAKLMKIVSEVMARMDGMAKDKQAECESIRDLGHEMEYKFRREAQRGFVEGFVDMETVFWSVISEWTAYD